jgi:hypothetical protein
MSADKQTREAIIGRMSQRCAYCGRELAMDQLRLHHLKEGTGHDSKKRRQDYKRWLSQGRKSRKTVTLMDTSYSRQ